MKSSRLQGAINRIAYLKKSGVRPIRLGWGTLQRSWKDILLLRPNWQFIIIYEQRGYQFREVLFCGPPTTLPALLHICQQWNSYQIIDPNQPEHDHQ